MHKETEAEIIVRARADDIMDVIADLPSYPEWCPGVKSAVIVQSFGSGRPREIEMILDSGPIQDTVHYVYDWSEKKKVQWWQTQGEILASLNGSYTCARVGHGSTLVTYRLTIDVVLPMIGALQRRAEKHIVSTALKGLKERVESQS